MLKKLILILVTVFSFCFAEAQVQALNQAPMQTKVDYVGWQLSNQGCWGCPSFYWKVMRSTYSLNGVYVYNIWFQSNSFYPNGVYASTYLWGIRMYVDGTPVRNEGGWLLFKEATTHELYGFTTPSPVAKIYLTWEGLKIY